MHLTAVDKHRAHGALIPTLVPSLNSLIRMGVQLATCLERLWGPRGQRKRGESTVGGTIEGGQMQWAKGHQELGAGPVVGPHCLEAGKVVFQLGSAARLCP